MIVETAVIDHYPILQPLNILFIFVFIGIILFIIYYFNLDKIAIINQFIFFLKFLLILCFFTIPIIVLYSFIYGTSIQKSIITIIVPFFKLFINLFNMFVILLYLPYYIIITIWDMIKKIINIFKYVYTVINYLTSLIYLTQNSLLS
jgi:hypothetical protein